MGLEFATCAVRELNANEKYIIKNFKNTNFKEGTKALIIIIANSK